MDEAHEFPRTESPAPEPSWRFLKRPSWLFSIAALIALIVFGFIEWSHQWDNPKFESIPVFSGLLYYKGNPIKASIECYCPPHFIESRDYQDLSLTFKLNKETPSNPLNPRPSVPGGGLEPATPEDLASSKPDHQVSAFVESNDTTTKFFGLYTGEYLGTDRDLIAGINRTIPLSITSIPSGIWIDIYFSGWNATTNQTESPFHTFGNLNLERILWRPPTRRTFLVSFGPFFYSVFAFAVASTVLFLTAFFISYRYRQVQIRTERQLLEAQKLAAARPGETHFAWESARIKLESYFDRNLIQVNLVFWMAVFLIIVGLGFVIVGVFVWKAQKDYAALLTVGSGILTQFIGATFMVIYRSTMRQANEFMNVLDRINTVGMAVHELDRIPDGDLKNKGRERMVEMLIGSRGARLTEGNDTSNDEK